MNCIICGQETDIVVSRSGVGASFCEYHFCDSGLKGCDSGLEGCESYGYENEVGVVRNEKIPLLRQWV